MRNQLTALSALASMLREDSVRSGNASFAEHARLSAGLVGDMVDSVNAFLDGPFGESGEVSRAPVNECLRALLQFFLGGERWAAEGKRLAVRDLRSDTLVECAPLDLVNGLRHLAEYFLLRIPAGGEVGLTASIVHSASQMAGLLDQAACVLNREAVRKERPYAVFRVSGGLPEAAVDEIRDAFSFGLQGGRIGNLNVLGEVLSSARGAAFINRAASGGTTVEAAFPVSL
jgi:hypothetical protein